MTHKSPEWSSVSTAIGLAPCWLLTKLLHRLLPVSHEWHKRAPTYRDWLIFGSTECVLFGWAFLMTCLTAAVVALSTLS